MHVEMRTLKFKKDKHIKGWLVFNTLKPYIVFMFSKIQAEQLK
jgi:hypothetical protein